MIFGSSMIVHAETHEQRTDRLSESVAWWANEATLALVVHANPDAALEALLRAEELCRTLRYHLTGKAA